MDGMDGMDEMGWDSVFGVGVLLRDSICLDFPPEDILGYS